MTAVAGRVWGWVRPSLTYRPWAGKTVTDEKQMEGSWGGITTWFWGGWRKKSDQKQFAGQYCEKEENVQTADIEKLLVGKLETEAPAKSGPRWWRKILPTHFLWPKSTDPGRQKGASQNKGGWESDQDGESSDYGTPPPSPTPPLSHTSPFSLFTHSWKGEILPEHYEISFNFLRHLFDLFVVGFLWTVSPPVRVILDFLGVQGTLKLWIHGMALFFVSTVGMAGLLWLIQEYLPYFALVYGVVQVLVISVSIRQSVGVGDVVKAETEKGGGEEGPTEEPTEENGKGKTVSCENVLGGFDL